MSLPPPQDLQQQQQQTAAQAPPEEVSLPPGIEPLVLWDPAGAGGAAGADDVVVEVDVMLTRWGLGSTAATGALTRLPEA